MTVAEHIEIDTQKYRRMLGRLLPKAIRTEEENERMLAEINKLMSKGEENLSPEEGELLNLMAILIEAFEEEHYPLPQSPPGSKVKMLMEDRGLRAVDLVPVLGSRSRVSELLSGKRLPSKAQAKALAEFFHLPVELFI
jgi:HTH-type transcriptional regulator/antitoxin HigA